MVLKIENPDVERKVRELARKRKISITEAINQALDEELKQEAARSQQQSSKEIIEEIAARYQQHANPDAPSYEEIMEEMYDEFGAPR